MYNWMPYADVHVVHSGYILEGGSVHLLKFTNFNDN